MFTKDQIPDFKFLESKLRFEVELELPAFAKECQERAASMHQNETPIDISFHQDAFASSYQQVDYLLLGKAIKYAGLHGVGILICGTNRETCDDPNLLQTI